MLLKKNTLVIKLIHKKPWPGQLDCKINDEISLKTNPRKKELSQSGFSTMISQ
jgi:hypothetical protein